MKNIFLLVLFVLSVFAMHAQKNINSVHFKNTAGEEVTADVQIGQKILFIILPGAGVDTGIVHPLQRFQNRFGDTVKIIGILSREDGYQDSDLDSVKIIYQSLIEEGMVLTEGLYLRQKEDPLQPELARWLTNKEENQFTDMEISGRGEKFLVDENGKLIAVFGGDLSLDDAPVISAVNIE